MLLDGRRLLLVVVCFELGVLLMLLSLLLLCRARKSLGSDQPLNRPGSKSVWPDGFLGTLRRSVLLQRDRDGETLTEDLSAGGCGLRATCTRRGRRANGHGRATEAPQSQS